MVFRRRTHLGEEKKTAEKEGGEATGTTMPKEQQKTLDSDFQRSIREVKEHRGWCIQELADELRVSDQIAERWLQGKSRPTTAISRRLIAWAENEVSR